MPTRKPIFKPSSVRKPHGARYRDLAMKWRLLEVEAVFMGAIQATLADDETPD